MCLLIVSSSTPVIKRLMDVGNKLSQIHISSNHTFQVPPFVSHIAAVIPWLLELAPTLLCYCYKAAAVNLCFVCDSHGDYHIHPLDAHLSITGVNNLLDIFYPITVWKNAKDAVMEYLQIRWGRKIQFARFQHILLDGYYFIQRYYGYGFLYFAND
jgi:hypothetical protein